MEVVRHAVDDGRCGKQGNGNKKCFTTANKVRYESAHKTAACHGCEIPEGDRAYIAHGQPPVLHQCRGNEPEVPVVHLFAKIRHHNNEKDGFMATSDLKSVEVVIADSLLAGHGFFLLALGVKLELFSVVLKLPTSTGAGGCAFNNWKSFFSCRLRYVFRSFFRYHSSSDGYVYSRKIVKHI